MTLSSCYFCGTAIEEPLSEYPVVPDAFAPSPEEQGTVVLCPSCHRKLSRVMDHVVTAVDDRQQRLDRTAGSVESDRATASNDADAASPSADSAADAAGTSDGLGVDDPPSIDDDVAEDLLGTESSSDAGESADTGPSDEPRENTDPTHADETRESTGRAHADETEVSVEVETPDETPGEPQADDGITVDDGGASGERAGDAGGGESNGDSAGGPGTTGGSADDSGTSAAGSSNGPPQATYNRVVRLLQNREFPVERGEIATVASNAYEIPPEDFDAVIETAVDRGVLVEDGQYLKQPE